MVQRREVVIVVTWQNQRTKNEAKLSEVTVNWGEFNKLLDICVFIIKTFISPFIFYDKPGANLRYLDYEQMLCYLLDKSSAYCRSNSCRPTTNQSHTCRK